MTLPKGWAKPALREITPSDAPIIYGILQPGPDLPDGIPYVRPSEIHNGTIDIFSIRRTSQKIAKQYVRSTLKTGDIILSIVGTIGKVAETPSSLEGGNITQSSCRIRPEPALVEGGFLKAFLRGPAATAQYDSKRLGTAVPRLNIADIRDFDMPLPPQAEQRRIVAKLDALIARLARARAELDRVPVLADRLRENGLSSAFEGTLIDEGGNPLSNWATVPFEEVGEIASNLVAPSTISALPHIAPNHIQSGRPALLPYRTIGEDEVISGKHRFYPGQLIYSKIRPNLRKVVLVDFEGGCSADMYPINARCNPRYLLYWMLSPQFTWLATQQEGRTVLPKINQNSLNAIATPVAPSEIQERIAAALDTIFARADRLEAEAARARALIDRLESAILTRAFRGELVPQDPNDEPANVLLDRVRAERAAAPKAKRGRRAASADAA